MDSNNPNPILSNPSQQLAKHAPAEGGNGFSSYFTQLTDNPFFTAVCVLIALSAA
jgi:chaperone BCS1